MRPKYFSLIGLHFITLAVAATLWFDIRGLQDRTDGAGHAAIRPLADIAVPTKAVLDQMDRLVRYMPMLAAPAPQLRNPADLSAFGYRDVTPAGTGPATGAAGETLSASHRLTLAFEGRARRFCVIDGRLYREGASLPDGATIIKIESRRVLIAKKSIQQWLVADPLEQDDESGKS